MEIIESIQNFISACLEVSTSISTGLVLFVIQQFKNPIFILSFGIVLFVLFLFIIFNNIKKINNTNYWGQKYHKFSKKEIKEDNEWVDFFNNY